MSRSSSDPAILSAAITAAVESVRAADPDRFEEASGQLTALDIEQVGIVQAAMIRSLLEELHPDGLDADDVRELLTRCEKASWWFPSLDVDQLLLVFSSALGVLDPDEQQPHLDRGLLTRHATVVIAELSAGRPAMSADHLRLAIAEIRRAETMEMP